MFEYFRRYQPTWLYELMPYLYATAGLATILLLRNLVAWISGILLVTAGAMVWYMRRTARMAGAGPSGSPRGRGVVNISWSSSYESGNPRMDQQHLALFALANDLMAKITAREPAEAINASLRALIRDVQAHFKDEEELLYRLAPTLVEAHRQAHARLLREARRLSEGLAQKSVSMRELAGFVVFDMVTDHLLREDQALFPALRRASERNS